jgi:hypothetical protein
VNSGRPRRRKPEPWSAAAGGAATGQGPCAAARPPQAERHPAPARDPRPEGSRQAGPVAAGAGAACRDPSGAQLLRVSPQAPGCRCPRPLRQGRTTEGHGQLELGGGEPGIFRPPPLLMERGAQSHEQAGALEVAQARLCRMWDSLSAHGGSAARRDRLARPQAYGGGGAGTGGGSYPRFRRRYTLHSVRWAEDCSVTAQSRAGLAEVVRPRIPAF